MMKMSVFGTTEAVKRKKLHKKRIFPLILQKRFC